MNDSESSNNSILDEDENTPEIILNLDYMISIKIYFENDLDTDLNILNSGLTNNELLVNDVILIKKIYYYLKDLNKTFDEIKNAFCLLYDSIDPANKDNVISLLNQLNNIPNTVNQISDIFTMVNTMNEINTDTFTGDIINPSLFLNLFNHNLNNIHGNNNIFHNIFNMNAQIELDNFNVPMAFINTGNSITYQWTTLLPPIIQTHSDVKNVATDNILNENTRLIRFNELDDTNKNRYKTCSICIDDFILEDEIRQLSCSHIFHTKCVDPWLLKESYKCPMCRDDTLPHEPSSFD
jgi:hypothetical protein